MRSKLKIVDILNSIPMHPYALLHATEPIEYVKRRLEQFEVLRNLYVIDNEERLIGYVSLGRLIRYLTSTRRKTSFHYHTLLEYVSAKTVLDLMEEDIVFARKMDLAEDVLHKMIWRGIKEVPVIDEGRRVISNVGILDLWRFTEDRVS
ncbi:hypothetical protein DBT_1291 [Dissulfuribacter thermophilus]|uniref:CBS domain-containing protein n=1 Tax=Dissulfuribacter thermophilus TaxID=1156395 RepID=A0A1B9F5X7_9BACT|nr:CBS domain-containing protein [Dissulfuribacter thermophilus]OCC15171.1 hypothetical protein DBT_1291 [Dissulfuribacter thermophilus]